MEVNKPTLEPWNGVDDWNLLYRTGCSLTPLQARGLTFQKVPAASSRSLRCCTAEKQRNCQGNWIFSSALLHLYLLSTLIYTDRKKRDVFCPLSRFEFPPSVLILIISNIHQFRSQCDNCLVECWMFFAQSSDWNKRYWSFMVDTRPAGGNLHYLFIFSEETSARIFYHQLSTCCCYGWCGAASPNM